MNIGIMGAGHMAQGCRVAGYEGGVSRHDEQFTRRRKPGGIARGNGPTLTISAPKHCRSRNWRGLNDRPLSP